MTDVISTPNTVPAIAPQQQVSSQTPSPLVPTSVPPNSWRHPRFSRNLLIILVGIAVVLGLILLGVNHITPKPKSVALPPDELLATVGDQKIYTSTVVAAAKEQYTPSAVNNDVIRKYLDVVIERDILNLQAKQLNIKVMDQDVTSTIQQSGQLKFLNNTNYRSLIKYQLIKKQIMLKQVKSVEAYDIGFWIPPVPYPQRPIYIQQRSDGKKALNEAEVKLKSGMIPLDVAQYIYNTYPVLQINLALNGYIFGTTTDKSMLMRPKVYTFDKTDINSLGNPEYYQFLLNMKAGDIQVYSTSDDSGGDLIQVIAKNTSGFSNYDEFLTAKKKELVKLVTTK